MEEQAFEETYCTYGLLIEMGAERVVQVGALGAVEFDAEEYVYTGSATTGLVSRIRRHLSDEKTLFWHIDYLLQYARVRSVYVSGEAECEINRRVVSLQEVTKPVNQFGSSDCSCDTHLSYLHGRSGLEVTGLVPVERNRFLSVDEQDGQDAEGSSR